MKKTAVFTLILLIGLAIGANELPTGTMTVWEGVATLKADCPDVPADILKKLPKTIKASGGSFDEVELALYKKTGSVLEPYFGNEGYDAQDIYTFTITSKKLSSRSLVYRCTATAKSDFSPEYAHMPGKVTSGWHNSETEARHDCTRQILSALAGMPCPDDFNPDEWFLDADLTTVYSLTYETQPASR